MIQYNCISRKEDMEKNYGVFPTMITPYKDDGNVDYEGVKELVDWYYKKNCDGIFAVCQSSEIHYLTLEERVNIAKTVLKRRDELAELDKNRKPMTIVISGHVSDSFADQVEELTELAKTKPDALILITNRFDIENTSEDKWIEDLDRMVNRLDPSVPLGLYECPKPYKRLITKKMLEYCVKSKRFKFIKDTCCDAEEIKRRVDILDGSGFELYNANAQTYLQTIRDGANGYCGVMANFHPELYGWLLRHKDSEKADLVQSFLCMSAFTEALAYPCTAKYYLNHYEHLNIKPYSRVRDYHEVTEYQKSCLKQMKQLSDYIKEIIKE